MALASATAPRGVFNFGILRGHMQSSLRSREMKRWSTPHSDVGIRVNYNGPKVGNPSAGRGMLPPMSVTIWVQSAICWKTR